MADKERPVVVIPGYFGSKLRDAETRHLAWLDGRSLVQPRETLEALRLDIGDPERLVADGILDEVPILPFVSPDIYKRLTRFLRKTLGYPPEQIHEIAYDWRRSLAREAAALHRRIEQIRPQGGTGKVDLIAHSHGALVARSYMRRFGAEAVNQLISVGAPHKGMIKIFVAVARGMRAFVLFKPSSVRTASRGFPSAYELLPRDPADGLFRWNGKSDDPFANDAWCDTVVGDAAERAAIKARLAAAAAVVAVELPDELPVKSCLIYGTHRMTKTLATGTAQGLDFEETDEGDGTVPTVSARGDGLTGAQGIHRFAIPFGRHMLLYSDPAVEDLLAHLLTQDTPPAVHFVARFRREPFFIPNTTNSLVVVVQDAAGNTPPGTEVRLTIENTGTKNVEVPQTADGDFQRNVRIGRSSRRRFPYTVTAIGPSVPEQVHRGELVST